MEKSISYTRILKAAADSFRLGREGQGSEDLVRVIDLLVPLLQDPVWPNREETNALLAELLDAQSRKDYLHVADILEYELAKWFIGCEVENSNDSPLRLEVLHGMSKATFPAKA